LKTLKNTKIGETVTILKVRGEGALRRRLMDMGLTKGAKVFIRKEAPMGDPLELNIRGYELTLRRSDAEAIEVI
jgi:ferrous iron transport protein A